MNMCKRIVEKRLEMVRKQELDMKNTKLGFELEIDRDLKDCKPEMAGLYMSFMF